MINSIKNLIRPLIPKSVFKILQPYWHGAIAIIAHILFGKPSKEVFVIGVTGTAGKSTTVMMLAHILNKVGKKTGYITTVATSDGNKTALNKQGMSMPSGWILQQTLHHFAATNCKYAIIEATSEGLAQNRHLGINFAMALFTNLSPAHLDSHGTFENYRAAKGKLFSSLRSDSYIGVNVEDPNAKYFSDFPARKKFGTSTREDRMPHADFPVLKAEHMQVGEQIKFKLKDVDFELNLKGSFNINNALLAIAASHYLGVSLEDASEALLDFGTVAGRMEAIPNELGITIIVDYAPEPKPMEQSLRACLLLKHQRLVHVFGSTGGHRDVSKRFEFGKISAGLSDKIIIANDDVYESDPEEIAKNILEGINQTPNKKVKEIETILDRKQAITSAITTSKPGDLILITGKGSEQFLVLPNNHRISWDDREIVKEILKNL